MNALIVNSKKTMPIFKPSRPFFGSGPTVKYPGWSMDQLDLSLLGRSHRSPEGVKSIYDLIEKTKTLLNIPSDYYLALVPGSATGAMAIALLNFLGDRPVSVFSYDVFGKNWLVDLKEQLMPHLSKPFFIYEAEYGTLPDFKKNFSKDHDTIFVWNGTTSGTAIQDHSWISNEGQGLTICDATSAAFCVSLPFEKLDITIFSWQKGLGGEGGHGMIALSPKAYAYLSGRQPILPTLRVSKITNQTHVLEGLFRGETLNTPSMLAVADFHSCLNWAMNQGGNEYLYNKTDENFKLIWEWLVTSDYFKPMAQSMEFASKTSVTFCFRKDLGVNGDALRGAYKQLATLLKENDSAYDVVNHAKAPPSFRIWCGPTVEKEDLHHLIQWFNWAYKFLFLC